MSIIGLLWKVSVFSNDLKGQVDIRITNNDGAAPSVTINTSVNTIQVPIPSEEEVTLESTEKLIKRLETAGAKKEKSNRLLSVIRGRQLKKSNKSLI